MPFLRDLKIALRSLSRAPALWITVAVTLALGIGANAAIFSVVRAVLLRPLSESVREPAALRAPERSRHRHRQRDVLRSGNSRPRARVKNDPGVRHLFRDRLHRRGTRHATRNTSGCGGWQLLQGDGAASDPGTLVDPQRRWPKCSRRDCVASKFWSASMHHDPNVIGKTVRLDS